MCDLVVIGGGPAGYTAAKKAAELGKSVCLIEKEYLGGVCLNKGCIPTKFFVNSAEIFSNIKKSAQFGIDVGCYRLNIKTILQRKDLIIEKHRQAIERLLNRLKVKIIKGKAQLKNANTIEVLGEIIEAKNIIIATGSKDIETDTLKFDHNRIISSEDALMLEEIPSSVVIIGAGYIGCEFACIYNQFGCDVTITEMQPQILPGEDEEIAKRLMQSMKRRGIKILLNTKINNLDEQKAEKILLTIGRKPNIEGLSLESCGVKIKDGAVVVNDKLQTSVKNIYAAGDVIADYCLAYTAFYEGPKAAENIFTKPSAVDYGVLPNCIFTMPEVASVGLNEAEARKKGYEVKVASYPFMASSRAHILDQTEGIIKLVTDAKTDKILGAQIFGPSATELIHELVVVISNNMSAKALSRIIHAHPTLSEALIETAKNLK